MQLPCGPGVRLKRGELITFVDIDVENCAICRNHIYEPCIDCQANLVANAADECETAWGVCNHAFHFHCISRWIKQRPVCPLCQKEWDFQRYGKAK